MKIKILSILAMMLMAVPVTQAQTKYLVCTLDGTQTNSQSSYDENSEITQDGITWVVTGNTSLEPWRIGGSKITGVDRPIYSMDALDDTIMEVTVDIGSRSRITVNSFTLIVASDAAFQNVIDTKNNPVTSNSTVSFTPTAGKVWYNAYYKFVFNVTASGNNNYFQFTTANFYAATPKPVTSVTLNQNTAELTMGDKLALTATVLPVRATDKSVTWTSSDEAVATVSTNGTVTANAIGTATITVTTTDGSLSAACTVTVNSKTYDVTLSEDTEDADNWTIDPTAAYEGQTVTVTYNGTKRVKDLKLYNGTDLSMVDNAGKERNSRWTANCYMVQTAGDYKLPLVYGNAIKDGQTNAAAYTGVTDNNNATATFPRHDGNAITSPWIKYNGITVVSAELLWQDAEGLVTAVGITGDYLTLTVGVDAATQEGNAVVAAKDGEGNIVWSWHIWVTTQTFADNDLTTVATGSHNYKVTPVNLGWVATGGNGKQGYCTYYQWGRKDAFKGTGALADANVYDINGTAVMGFTHTSSTDATIADNIKNPTRFYNVTNYMPNTATYYNLWDAQDTAKGNVSSATVKTVYDPCPPGFCVPTSNLYYFMSNNDERSMTTYDNTNKGATWSNSVVAGSITDGNDLWFPIVGLRNISDGAITNPNDGYYWSASPNNSNNGRDLTFYSSRWINSSHNRATGCVIRAVAEE